MANGTIVADAKHRPQGAIGEVDGVGHATTGSVTDKLTREHRMTLDEAHLVLNTKREEGIEQILKVRPVVYRLHAPTCCDLRTDQNYEHLFRANSPAEVPPTTSAPA